MRACFSVDGISRRFGGYLALDNVSCEIAAGGIHALIGPNGAGKTTLFNVISGLLRPNGGHVFFQGQDYTGSRPDLVSAMGIARNFQQVRLFPGLSVTENVVIGAHHAPTGGQCLGKRCCVLGFSSRRRARRARQRRERCSTSSAFRAKVG